MSRLLDLESQNCSLKLVYTLYDALKNDPERVKLTQELTLDETRSHMGLKGTHGLFGSDEWWDSVYTRKIKLKFLSGVITSTYYAGMDSDRRHNSYELKLENGSLHLESFYANNKKDIKMYRVGRKVLIAYAQDELKKDKGRGRYSETPIEIAISYDMVPLVMKSAKSGSR
ncbi:hypothetical protein MO867_22390 [Microbulbifer sp. OS29]|uniref:Uncharacterized protein n=1 Tax=Microbulbifer okhotskensis TaxID=2926617 RepID=A0A9X2ESM3_9GAMM|nr:hypothetical protein [Microbulbifer okhotskensis]MCO1337076.1 hypothetical protein [Microbulbifer okhotskensis]